MVASNILLLRCTQADITDWLLDGKPGKRGNCKRGACRAVNVDLSIAQSTARGGKSEIAGLNLVQDSNSLKYIFAIYVAAGSLLE